MEPVQCSVTGVFVAASEQGSAPVVLLSPGNNQVIPIFVGLFEAVSIHNALIHDVPPRPLTHDLFIDLTDAFHITLDSVTIDQIEDGVYFARLAVMQDHREITLDCRPSDGIALAIRAGTKILIEQEVIQRAAVDRENLSSLRDFQVSGSH